MKGEVLAVDGDPEDDQRAFRVVVLAAGVAAGSLTVKGDPRGELLERKRQAVDPYRPAAAP